MPLADTLLQLAEAGHYHPAWSTTLLEETRRNLASKMGLHPARAARRIELMRQAFPWAEADPLPELIEGDANPPPGWVCAPKVFRQVCAPWTSSRPTSSG